MKRTLSLLALIAALVPLSPLTAEGELITVKGIEFQKEGDWSTATGWYDACKAWSGDGLLCWAATSSNMIAWWQAQNPDYKEEGDPWGMDAVWDIYKNTFINEGGIISKGVEWWFDGTGTGTSDSELQYKEGHVSNGAYYKEHLHGGVVEKNVTPPNITTLYSSTCEHATTLANTLVDYMRNGYAVGLNFNSGKNGHAETLWGIEYDTSSQLITRLYITDSDDDQKPGIRILDMSVKQHDGYQTFCQTGTNWEIESFVLLSSSMTNDIARLNTYDAETGTVNLRQQPESGGYLLPESVKEFNNIVYDNSRNEETAGREKPIGRQLTVDAAHDGTHAEAILVEATQGANLLEIQQGVTLQVDEISGAGTLTKTGAGTLKISGDASATQNAHINVTGGTLLCENGTLGEISINGGTLEGSGKINGVTVDKDGVLVVGNAAPGVQTYTNRLTLTDANLVFYVAGWRLNATDTNNGWDSGRYSNISLEQVSDNYDLYVDATKGIQEITIAIGGDALKNMSRDGTFSLDLITDFNNYYLLPDSLNALAARTTFVVADDAEAVEGTDWAAGTNLTEYFDNISYRLTSYSYGGGPYNLTMVGTYRGATPPAPVPEPATGALGLLALAGLCIRRRRK